MQRKITRTLSIIPEFRDFDMMGVVHNCVYFEWFERGRLLFTEEFMPFDEALKHSAVLVVRENSCVYEYPVRSADELSLITVHSLSEVYSGTLEFFHELLNKKSKISHARGRSVCTLVDLRTGGLVRKWDEGVWTRYAALK